jgi:hypothetical protein
LLPRQRGPIIQSGGGRRPRSRHAQSSGCCMHGCQLLTPRQSCTLDQRADRSKESALTSGLVDHSGAALLVRCQLGAMTLTFVALTSAATSGGGACRGSTWPHVAARVMRHFFPRVGSDHDLRRVDGHRGLFITRAGGDVFVGRRRRSATPQVTSGTTRADCTVTQPPSLQPLQPQTRRRVSERAELAQNERCLSIQSRVSPTISARVLHATFALAD